MSNTILIRRGASANTANLANNEIGYGTDDKNLYIGNGDTPSKFYNSSVVDQKLDNKISKSLNTINVADYGAKGDGVTDDTQAFIQTFNATPDNSTIIIPSGEYIVYKGLDGTITGDAVLLQNCVLLKNKKNIDIICEGNVLIRPNEQGVSVDKRRFPCTLAIDKCENITIRNIKIDSKGENFGDADAGVGLSFGDLRTNFNIQNGGSAIHISRSKNVKVYDSEFRLCGSCGVVYFSSISSCGIYNSFSNPASLGYASYAHDTWVDGSTNYDNTLEIINCKTWKETIVRDNITIGSTQYSSKGGVVLEGDSNTVNVTIKNCIIKDAYANGADKQLGNGVVSCNAITLMDNCLIENCANVAYKRDTLTSNGKLDINNCIGRKLRTGGIVIKDLYSLTNRKEINITNNVLEIEGSVIYPESEQIYLHEAHGICNGEYRDSGVINISNNKISSPSNTIFQIAFGLMKISNNTLTSNSYVINNNGGGKIELFANKISRIGYTKDSKSNVILNSLGLDSSVGIYEIAINNNEFNGLNPSDNCLAIISTNPTNLITLISCEGNVYNNCCVISSSNNKMPLNKKPYVKLQTINGLVGEYTSLTLDFSNNLGITKGYKIIADNNAIYDILPQTDSVNGNLYLQTIYITGDVRSLFKAGSYYNLF